MRCFGFLAISALVLTLCGQGELTWEALSKPVDSESKLVILPSVQTGNYRRFAEKIWPGVKQMTDAEYLAAGDQASNTLIVLGPAGSNSLLARVGPDIPLQFRKDTVLWVKWRHAVHPSCPMLIVTGPTDEVILSSGNPGDTPFDYLALRGGENVESGYFHRVSPSRPLGALVVYDRAVWIGDQNQVRKSFTIAKTLTPTEALSKGLKNQDAFAAGTPENNRFIAEVLKKIKISVGRNNITARGTHTGDNLILYAKAPPMYENSNIRIIAGNNAKKMREFTFNDRERTLADYDYAVIDANTNTTLEYGLYPGNEAKFQAQPAPPTPKTLMLEDFDRLSDFLLNSLQNIHTNKQVYGIDIPAILKEAREKITGNESPQKFMFLLDDILGACKGDHLNITPGPVPGRKYIDTTNGISGRGSRDAAYIFGSVPDGDNKEVYDYYSKALRAKSLAANNDYGPLLMYFNGDYYTKYDYIYNRTTYPRGMKLLSVNGRNVRELQDSLQPKFNRWDWSASKFYDESFCRELGLSRGDRLDLVFLDRDGKEMTMPFVVRARQRQRFPRYKMSSQLVTLFENSGLLYIRLPRMQDDKPYLEKIRQIDPAKVRAVVLDIRFNPGGGDNVWVNILGALVANPIRSRYQQIRRNTPLLGYYSSAPTSAVRVPFLNNEEFLVRPGGFQVRPSRDSLKLDVPVYILTKDIFSAAGKMMLFAKYSDQLITLGECNPLINHAVAKPEHFYLPNSRLLVRVKVAGNIDGCTSAEDLLNSRPEIELKLTLDDLLNFWNPDQSLPLEEQLAGYDPYFRKVLELTKQPSTP